jgi:hypothetical protein
MVLLVVYNQAYDDCGWEIGEDVEESGTCYFKLQPCHSSERGTEGIE